MRKCPRCGDAKDFFVDVKFNVNCGYCGFTIARIKNQFQQSVTDCKQDDLLRERKLKISKLNSREQDNES